MIDLESYLIPAEEGAFLNELKNIAKDQIKEAGKEILPSLGAFALMCSALGIYSKIKERKDKKTQAEKSRLSDEARNRAMREAFIKVDQKYKLSEMSKSEYGKFVDKMYDKIIIDIRKALKPLNSKEVLNKYKLDYISLLRKWAEKDNDPHEYDDDIKEAERIFKPGLFQIDDNSIGDYVSIINADQDICIACSSVCDEIADALALKYTEFVDAGLFGVGTGDGDEGCVYPEFVSYETMRKRCSM